MDVREMQAIYDGALALGILREPVVAEEAIAAGVEAVRLDVIDYELVLVETVKEENGHLR